MKKQQSSSETKTKVSKPVERFNKQRYIYHGGSHYTVNEMKITNELSVFLKTEELYFYVQINCGIEHIQGGCTRSP